MTPAVRYCLEQLEQALAQESLVLAEFYAEQLRRELSATEERVGVLNHEQGRCEP